MSGQVYTLHCEYCGKDFQTVYATKKWHNCEEALEQKRKIKNETSRKWREKHQSTTDKPYMPRQKNRKANMKRCITPRCTNMTVNYFGRCDHCLSEFERNYDIDCIAIML